uniref:Cyclin dependent kinase 7 n=1 Tax=Brachionus manjavacas TaxID=667381 RepID=M4SZJ3_9BILA|nr:Cyclin dependent kinase 7 [Brachionus manjavacas]
MQAEKSKRYEKLNFLGEGQFATVYKARDKETGIIVAIKKIKFGNRVEAADGINRTALREIKLLKELGHINIIKLYDVFGQGSNVSLVYDFMVTDLEEIIRDRENIVVTRWYRAPELLFGSKIYATGIDIWEPLLPGNTDLDQLVKIFDIFGTPNETNWPNAKLLPDFVEFKPCYPKPLKMIFSAVTPDVIFVLEQMLHLNPLKRTTCREALTMTYFGNAPGPTPPEDLPQPQSVMDRIKNKSDALTRNPSKRKLSDETSSFLSFFKTKFYLFLRLKKRLNF